MNFDTVNFVLILFACLFVAVWVLELLAVGTAPRWPLAVAVLLAGSAALRTRVDFATPALGILGLTAVLVAALVVVLLAVPWDDPAENPPELPWWREWGLLGLELAALCVAGGAAFGLAALS